VKDVRIFFLLASSFHYSPSAVLPYTTRVVWERRIPVDITNLGNSVFSLVIYSYRQHSGCSCKTSISGL